MPNMDVLVLKALNVEEGAPTEVQLAPLGEYTDGLGKRFRLTEEDVAGIIENAGTQANDRPIDYEHQTLKGSEAPAAGWVKKLVNRGKDGLWGAVDWTAKAKEYFKSREYRYLSPVLLASKKDADGFYRPSIFHSAGLTNTPQIDGMVPIVNRFEPRTTEGERIFNPHPSLPHQGGGATEKQEEKPMKKLLEMLGLKPEATEAEAVEALTVLQNKAATPPEKEVMPKEVVEALGLNDGANLSEVKATILALKQPGNVVSVQDFQALKKKLAEKDRDELVQLAMKEGKITAAQKDWAGKYALEDPEGFRMFVNKAPVVVPMDGMPGGGDRKKDGVEEVQALVNKALGIDEETFKKHNKKED